MLRLTIASERFELHLPDGPLADALTQAYRAFLADSGEGPSQLLRFTPDGRAAPPGVRQMPVVRGRHVVGAGFQAELGIDGAHVIGADERFGVESVLKLLLARALLRRGAILVHGVALGDGEACAVLLGESGAGKSTLGALGAGAGLVRLADELVALDVDGSAQGTPWNIGRAQTARLRLLGTLGWSEACRLEPLSAVDFLPLLLSNTLLSDDSPATRAAVFQLASGLLARHPPERFYFPPDASAPAFLRAALLSRAARPPPPTAG